MRKFIRKQLNDQDVMEIYEDKVVKYHIRYGKRCDENIIDRNKEINFDILPKIGYKEIK
jgi:hypothetical protein